MHHRKNTRHEQERNSVLAYYIKPEKRDGENEQIYEKMTEIIQKLKQKYYVILAGDGNAKLGELVGDTRNRPNQAGERFLRLMEGTGTRNIQPTGKGPHWTHYNVTKSRLTDRKT
jgi:hypothetical protein